MGTGRSAGAAMELVGERYLGGVVRGRMEGHGFYKLPTGTEYRGALWDGMFHGQGELFFPNGGRYRALWIRGIPTQMVSNTKKKTGITAMATTEDFTQKSVLVSNHQAFLSLQIWILPEQSQKVVMTVVMDSIILKPELLLTTNSDF
ncbi:MORN repeat-containing protein 5 isoform X3 [Empidonax traillii]|uniref:MORN repeat-containing protein 5 isoform X3 n=1 Tax=Empidonax traillii TaxID=164674 RepID=UPI000FFD5027|nr:MORN repeat-containing protein 5 isoform X3 [Empidonax traillii]